MHATTNKLHVDLLPKCVTLCPSGNCWKYLSNTPLATVATINPFDELYCSQDCSLPTNYRRITKNCRLGSRVAHVGMATRVREALI